MYKKYKIGAVIVAAGSGLRFGEKKQVKKLGSQPLYLYSLQHFTNNNLIDEIALVVPGELQKIISTETTELNYYITVVSGGALRQDSVLSGIQALSSDCDIICIHDAARPFIPDSLIQNTIIVCEKNDGAIAAVPSNDTVKKVAEESNLIKSTIPRNTVWLAQTPQTFHRKPLIEALTNAGDNNIKVTDEASLLESLNYSVVVVEGNARNIKITNQDDWEFAEFLLEKHNE